MRIPPRVHRSARVGSALSLGLLAVTMALTTSWLLHPALDAPTARRVPVSPDVTSATGTITSTSTVTPTASPATSTVSPTAAFTPTATVTATLSVTASATPTRTAPATMTVTITPTATPSPTATASATRTPPPTATPTPSATERTPPEPIYLPAVMRAHLQPTSVFGVQISETRFRDPRMIAGVRDAGAFWWRSFLFWDEVEPVRTNPPTYDWRSYDPLFQYADRQGLMVIAEIQGNPKWVAPFPGGPPNDLDALAQFLAAAVERYDGDGYNDAPGGPRVHYWELYNEPDNTDPQLAMEGRGWGYWGSRGPEYARMLKRVYPAIKIASRQAQVVFGGIAYDGFEPIGPFNPLFLDDVLAAGGGPFFDVMNFHFYTLYRWRWEEYGPDIIGKTVAVERKLAEYGLAKPVMVTESGYWSAAEPPFGPPSSPEEQARYVPQLYARGLAAGLLTVCWFQYDDVAGFDNPARGLVDGDLAPKPAHRAYELASELLSGAVPESPVRDPRARGEVYWFRRGGERLAVAWVNEGTPETLAVAAPAVERIHYLGSRVIARDAADGALDGITRVPYGSDPVYMRVLQE